MYFYNPPPADEKSFPGYVAEQLRLIAESQSAAVDGVVYRTLTAAPKRIKEGLVVRADGVLFNPGSGAGLYHYRGGAWRFLA